MPPQKVTTTLAKKLGAKLATAHQENVGKDYKGSAGGDLPEGITNGIAKLTSAKFGIFEQGDNKGQFYFMASGIVVDVPQDDLKWAIGLRTQWGPEPICDTVSKAGAQFNKTTAEHLEKVYNLWRGLGVNPDEIDAGEDGALEATAEAMQNAGIYFKFRTWKGKETPQFPNPRVQHDWGRACEYSPPEDAGGVQDETPPAPAPVAKPAPKVATPAAKLAAPAKGPAAKAKPAPAPEPEPAAEYTDTADIDSLLAAANDDSDETAQVNAQQALKDQAMSLGHDEATCDACPTWEALVALIKGEDAPTAEAFAVGEHYYYCPPDPKTKKPGKKVQCEVIAVDADAGTVDLQNGTNPKIKYKGVATDKLEGA